MNVIAGIVIDRVRIHRPDDGDVVDDLRGVRQQLAHPGPGLSVSGEPVDRFRHRQQRLSHRLGDALALADRIRDLRALVLRESRLVVERLELGRPAGLVQEDHPLRAWRMMRKPDQAAGLRIAGRRRVLRRQQRLGCDERGERSDADAARRQAEQLPACQVEIEFVFKRHGAPVGKCQECQKWQKCQR